jgi:hypothetical protein
MIKTEYEKIKIKYFDIFPSDNALNETPLIYFWNKPIFLLNSFKYIDELFFFALLLQKLNKNTKYIWNLYVYVFYLFKDNEKYGHFR